MVASDQVPTKQDENDTAVRPYFADIREEWEWVKEGVDEILGEQPELTFTAEHVYEACTEGSAHLWVAPEGFVVSMGMTDPYTGKRIFLIWLAWSKKRGDNSLSKYLDFFIEVARDNGYAGLETRSPIKRLEPHLTSEGWRLNTIVYTRELYG